jgi:hypothetical protein
MRGVAAASAETRSNLGSAKHAGTRASVHDLAAKVREVLDES